MRQFKSSDLGTQRDSQYRAAEKALLKSMINSNVSFEYKPDSTNLKVALSS